LPFRGQDVFFALFGENFPFLFPLFFPRADELHPFFCGEIFRFAAVKASFSFLGTNFDTFFTAPVRVSSTPFSPHLPRTGKKTASAFSSRQEKANRRLFP